MIPVIPLPYKILAFILTFTLFGLWSFNRGIEHEKAAVAVATAKAKNDLAKKDKQSAASTEKTVVEYKDRVITQTKIVYQYREKIDEKVPVDAVLPAAVVGVLDNQVLDSERAAKSASVPDGEAPAVEIDLRTATKVISDNYAQCYIWRANLESLQSWVSEQHEIYAPR